MHSNISKGTKKTYQISYPRKLLEWKIPNLKISSLRKHPFLLALRRWGRSSARNVPSGEERGETDIFAGYKISGNKRE